MREKKKKHFARQPAISSQVCFLSASLQVVPGGGQLKDPVVWTGASLNGPEISLCVLHLQKSVCADASTQHTSIQYYRLKSE